MQRKTSESAFDYIVVRTGPAGSVVTKRLSDETKHSVLALEAGGNESTNKRVRDSRFTIRIYFFQELSPQFYIPGNGVPQKMQVTACFLGREVVF